MVFARSYVVHPFLVLEVPADSFFDSFLELQAWLPSQFALELARVDGVPQIVACAVGDVRDKLLRRPLGVAQQPVHRPYDDPYQVDVLPFVEAPDVVRVGDFALVEDHVDGPCVVLDVEPVADVLPAAVHRQRPSVADIVDEQRDELLRELVGPVVVRTVGHQRRHPVRVVVSSHEVVGRGFRSRVGAVRRVLRLFGEELLAEGPAAALPARSISLGTCQLQRPVHLVGGDVVEQFALPLAVPVFPCRLEQRERAQDVRPREGERIPDRAVDMAFGRKVDDPVDVILPEQRPQHIQVADVTLLEHVVRGILDVPQVGKVPRVGQFVQVHDPVIRVFRHEQAYYVRADKARSARNQDGAFWCHYLVSYI